MTEEKKLFVYVAIGYILSLVVYFFLTEKFDLRLLFESLYIDKYRAELTIDRNLKLSENIDFYVDEDKRYSMLFRYFEAPLTYKEKLREPFIELKEAVGDYPVYMKDYKGDVHLINNEYVAVYVKENAFKNEVGMINLDLFNLGHYTMNISYNLYPPMQIDTQNTHLNFKFSGSTHVPYRNVEIYIHDPNNLIEKIYPHMPSFKIEKKEDGYLIKGNAYAGLVEVELLMERYMFNTFMKKIDNVAEKTEEENTTYFLYRKIFDTLKNLLYIAVFGFPIWAYVLYLKFGKEKSYVVPEYLSYIPNKDRTPYEVNLLFTGDSAKIDLNAFLATLLDLHKKKKIELSTEDDDLIIKVFTDNGDTYYEDKVLEFLNEAGIKINTDYKIFSLNDFNNFIEGMKHSEDLDGLSKYKLLFDAVAHYVDKFEIEATLDKKGKLITTILFSLSVIFTILSFIFGFIIGEKFVLYHYDFYPIFVLLVALSIETFSLFKTPTQIFGRWKSDFYKEYLEWQAFKNMLSNLAMIKKYKPEDLSIWKDWLIYGTALGVAKNVEEAMKELNIRLPDIPPETLEKVHYLPASYIALNKAYSYVQSKQSSDLGSGGYGGGGGFGVGGGFGGGGIGGR